MPPVTTATEYTKAGIDALLAGKVDTAKVGAPNGVAALDSSGKVPSAQIPSSGGAVTSVAGRGGAVVLASTDITDLTEAVQDIAGAAVVATPSGGVTVTYDDPAGTVSVAIDPAWKVPAAQMAVNGVMFINQNSDGTWPNRPTNRTDIKVFGVRVTATGANPASVTSPAVNGLYANDVVIVGA